MTFLETVEDRATRLSIRAICASDEGERRRLLQEKRKLDALIRALRSFGGGLEIR